MKTDRDPRFQTHADVKVGDRVLVQSTRKDCHFNGDVVSIGSAGLTVIIDNKKVRLYPWGQIAYVEKNFA